MTDKSDEKDSSQASEEQSVDVTSRGVLLQCQNGDLIRFDPTGLDLVLSDRVIDDIVQRLARRWSMGPIHSSDNMLAASRDTAQQTDISALLPEGLDAWGIRLEGEWVLFSARLPGQQGVRQFRRLIHNDPDASPPAIIAETLGSVIGIFGFGGPRRALGFDLEARFPYHVMTPADEIGAVGMAGLEMAYMRSDLLGLPEQTRESLVADTLLEQCFKDYKPLPLFMVRSETDSSPGLEALAHGAAFQNLLVAAESLQAAARRLGKPFEIGAVLLDFGLEEIESVPGSYQINMLNLLDSIADHMAKRGFRRPPVLSIFDCGTAQFADHPVLRAQYELSWLGQRHGFIYAAPGYMFEYDEYARPTATATLQMAEMQAAALSSLSRGQNWSCPTFLLAEWEDDTVIRVRADAMEKLVIDETDPFAVGPAAGFRLEGDVTGATITQITLCPDDPKDILVYFDRRPEAEKRAGCLCLLYGFGASPRSEASGFPALTGAIRDQWRMKSRSGSHLHRWALPAVLRIGPGQ